MQASATVWSGATFPPHCPGFTAAQRPLTYAMLGKRSGGPLSSPPFTKPALWSEARIRMIMWTLATVYQQGLLQLQCTAPTCSLWEGCTVFVQHLYLTRVQVHIRCRLLVNKIKCQFFLKNQLQEFLKLCKTWFMIYNSLNIENCYCYWVAEGQREANVNSPIIILTVRLYFIFFWH